MRDVDQTVDSDFEINLDTVKKRAIKGVAVLTGRGFILQIFALVAQGILWAYLTPEQFGVFWIVSAIINFLTYFSDIGLAAALIQKKDKPTDEDLKTTFTIQQGIVILLLIILYFVTPIFRNTHNLSEEGIRLLYALGISFLLSSLKSIPSVLLERRLEFGKFVLPQLLEMLVYNVAVVIFALRGFGIDSFTYSVLIRGFVGLITIYLLQPWKPGIAISKRSLKELLKFGIPYQVNTFLAVIKDDGMTILLGGILGNAGLGLLGWSQRASQIPLRIFMDNVTKVSFPAFSRMQHDKNELAGAVTKSIFFICFLTFPALIGILVLMPVLTQIIPRYEKWIPALLSLNIISINTFFAAVSTQLTNMFNAIGKIKTTFKLMIMWSVLTFAFVPVLSLKYSVVGASVGYTLVGISSIVVFVIAKKYVDFSITYSIVKPLFASIIMGAVLYLMTRLMNQSVAMVVFESLAAMAVYALASYWIIGKSVILDIKKGVRAFVNK